MAKNTTPVKPTSVGRQARSQKGPDIRKPLKTDMDSAREHGRCSPTKGKVFDPGYKS